jgi:hypothetical protein
MKYVVGRFSGAVITFDSETMEYTRTHSYRSWRLCAAADRNDCYLVAGNFGMNGVWSVSSVSVTALSLAYGISVIADVTQEWIKTVDFFTKDRDEFKDAGSCDYLYFDKHNFTKLCMITDVKILGANITPSLSFLTAVQDHLRGYT